jgi:hypothetical protein
MVADEMAHEGVRAIDPTPWFCSETVCPAIIGNILAYRDTSHMTATYSSALSPLLSEQLS